MGSEKRSDVVIVGGGIAGLAAAVRLAEAGVRVVLLETRKKLGGRATSFVDARSGRVLDNCQHVVLGCCTNYLDFLGRVGSRDKIRWTREQYWVEEGGRVSTLRPGVLPAPAHFTGSVLGAAFLSIGEKVQLARACARILRTDRAAWEDRTFVEFLRGCGQSERMVRRFWSPVIVSACNLDVARVSASSALHVFQEGFLAAAKAADIGVPAAPLVELYQRTEELIGRAGGRIELGAGVERLDETSAVTTDGRTFEAGQVVCAVPVERVNRVVDAGVRARDARFARLDEFSHSPILGVHLTFDRPVLARLPHAVLVDRATQWLFRKDDAGAYIHAVISAADEWLGLSEEQIGERVLADIHACLPESREAKLLEVRAVKEKLATWAPVPGIGKLRPSARGESKIVLAGDYTDTGWPATMEGAARSGYAAAAAVLGRAAGELMCPSLRVAWLARVMGLGKGIRNKGSGMVAASLRHAGITTLEARVSHMELIRMSTHHRLIVPMLLAAFVCTGGSLAQQPTTAPVPPPEKAGKPLDAKGEQPAKKAEGEPKSTIRFGAPTPIAKPERAEGVVRVAVYNVENLFDDQDDPALSGRYEDKGVTKPDAACKAAAAAIAAINADVLALTEVESKEALLWFRDKYLGDLGYQYAESIDAGDERGIEQAVLSKFPISDVKNWVKADLGGVHPDKWGRDENENKGKPVVYHRSPLRVTVTAGEQKEGLQKSAPYQVTLFVVHQKSGAPGNYWREKEAAKTVQLIGEFQSSHPDANVLVMGDFNAHPDQKPTKIITDSGLIDVFAAVRGSGKKVEPLYITHASGRVIDYIFLNAGAENELIRETRFILGTPTRPEGADYRTTLPPEGYASDHYPLVVDLVTQDK